MSDTDTTGYANIITDTSTVTNYRFYKIPNMELTVGDSAGNQLLLLLYEKKTLLHMIKWALFHWFFPFKITRWDKENN